jgi:hypothetical protein
MKRSTILQPLSRDHHRALVLAKACERAALSGVAADVALLCERAVREFAAELAPHFETEERELLPLLRGDAGQSLATRTLADHQLLRRLQDGLRRHDAETLRNFGLHLTAHVRFEERELFPALEALL